MKANVKHLPPQKADMQTTWADIGKAVRVIGWRPKVSLEEGIKLTVDWDNHHTPVAVSLIY